MSESAESPDAVRLMLAYLCVATEKEASLERKVEILDKFGLSDSEIAKICGSALQSIRNARHYIRKHGKKSKKAR
jgi:DNA-directed RNA polymerase specialized sigma24 family protein